MSDYIKREEATSIPVIPKEHRKHFNNLDDAFETGWNEALACVNRIPSAEVAEVVHCKDCKYADEYCHCSYMTWWNSPNDFCSRAEKRDK